MNSPSVLAALTLSEPAIRLPEGPPWLGWLLIVLGLALLALRAFLRQRR
jgi:hypothetical protein